MLRFWLPIFFCITFVTGGISPARAQEPGGPLVVAQASEGGGGLFRSLFGSRKKPQTGGDLRQEPLPDKRTRSNIRREKPKRSAGVARSSSPEPAEAKSPEAKRVLVVGDFMANALAKGLSEAFDANPDIDVINANNGASGLVRDDYYDWNAKIPALIAQHRASMLLVMIGGNDRQTIRAKSGQIPTSSDAWRTAYDAKVTEFADMLAAQGIPVVWLSLVPVSSGSLSRDYSGFNSLYSQKAELKGLRFADVWNGFADDKGGYVSSGPDINGQTRSLRTGDGLNFTRAGRRKLAFFVERDVARILSEGQSPLIAGLGELGSPGSAQPAPVIPAISPMIPIEMINVRVGSKLSTAPDKAVETVGEETEPTEIASRDGTKSRPVAAPPPGRADDYSWPTPE